MITKIGLVAGDIWNYLEKNNKKGQLLSLTKELGINKNVILMSLGWLAREGHIILEGDEDNYTVILTSGTKN
jgi:hypothetical protein